MALAMKGPAAPFGSPHLASSAPFPLVLGVGKVERKGRQKPPGQGDPEAIRWSPGFRWILINERRTKQSRFGGGGAEGPRPLPTSTPQTRRRGKQISAEVAALPSVCLSCTPCRIPPKTPPRGIHPRKQACSRGPRLKTKEKKKRKEKENTTSLWACCSLRTFVLP